MAMSTDQARYVLGVSSEASGGEMEAAYKLRAQMVHPDKHRSASPSLQAEALRATQQLTEAWDVLRRSLNQGNDAVSVTVVTPRQGWFRRRSRSRSAVDPDALTVAADGITFGFEGHMSKLSFATACPQDQWDLVEAPLRRVLDDLRVLYSIEYKDRTRYIAVADTWLIAYLWAPLHFARSCEGDIYDTSPSRGQAPRLLLALQQAFCETRPLKMSARAQARLTEMLGDPASPLPGIMEEDERCLAGVRAAWKREFGSGVFVTNKRLLLTHFTPEAPRGALGGPLEGLRLRANSRDKPWTATFASGEILTFAPFTYADTDRLLAVLQAQGVVVTYG